MKYCDPRYDVTFKKVFAQHKELMLSFLNALLPLEDDELIADIEYVSPELLPIKQDLNYSIVDVQCTDKAGRKFLVEMQMVWSEEFKSRVLFNASKAYVTQLESGNDYNLLQPVYSLNIVNDIFETDLPTDEYYHYYQLVHERHSEKVIKGLHIAFIELPKFKPKNSSEKRMLNLWLRFLTEINAKTKEVPKEMLADPLISKAVKLMEVEGMSETERYVYEKNLDDVRVERALMRESKEKGHAEGKEEGIEIGRSEGIEIGRAEGIEIGRTEGIEIGKVEGRAEGIEIGKVKGRAEGRIEALKETARKMLSQGMPIKVVSELTGLSKEELDLRD
jgi:predicted transposase/invertase (TIGR01784 family)